MVFEKEIETDTRGICTLTYAAPEILIPAEGGRYRYGIKSDIWSLALTFIAIMCGTGFVYSLDEKVVEWVGIEEFHESLRDELLCGLQDALPLDWSRTEKQDMWDLIHDVSTSPGVHGSS